MCAFMIRTFNTLEFCEYFELNLLFKTSATYDTINTASKLAGRNNSPNCMSCAKSEYDELRNVYNSCLPEYEKYKASLKKGRK